MKTLITLWILLIGVQALADFEHDRIRRIVVFPVQAQRELAKEAENLWWDLRDRLTQSKRFLVASRNFMQGKDVFQPRSELKPADAIILGRLLDSNALVTTYVDQRFVHMRVYETRQGLLLWTSDIELHAAVPASTQLAEAGRKLLYDFLASIPYQGHVIVDSLIGRPTYSEGEKLLFKLDVGIGTQVASGDTVQLVRVKAQSMKPVFTEGLKLEVYGEGKVLSVDRNIAIAQVTRMNDSAAIVEGAIVRIPDEAKRMQEFYTIRENPVKNVELSYLVATESELSEKEKERKPMVVSLSFIGSLALLLLIF